MRWGLGLLVVLAASACSFGGEEEAAAPPAPPAVPLVAASCERELVELDAAVSTTLEPVGPKYEEIAHERKRIAGPLRQLRKALSTVKAAAGRLRAFDAAHPGMYLPSDLYDYWTGLRDDYNAAFAAYKERLKRFRPLQRDFKALANDGKTLWKDVRRAIKAYEDELDGCLGPVAPVERVERDRIRQLEVFLAEVGDEIADRSTLVECADADSWEDVQAEEKGKADLLGYVRGGSRVAHLAPSICYALHRAHFLNWEPDLSCISASREADVPLCPPRVSELIRAAITVAHEAQHVAGVLNEKRAECFGLQSTALVARRLGVPLTMADQVAWYAWHFSEAPKSYGSRECRNDGRLDLDRNTSSFP
jgi:hypothetical protein